MARKVALIFVAGFIAGILIRSFVNFGGAFILFLLLLVFVSGVFGWRERGEERRVYFLIALFFLAAALGVLRYEIKEFRGDTSALDANVGEKVELVGYVSDEPDVRETGTRLVVNVANDRILVFAERYPEFRYGDRVKVFGELTLPENRPPESGEREFDWIAYLAKDDIHYVVFHPHIEKLEGVAGSRVVRVLFAIKYAFLDRLARVIPQPEAALAGGLVVGGKQSLGTELQNDFRRTGLIHMVVLSGYNLSIVGEYLIKIFGFFSARAAVYGGIGGILLFALLAGGGSATVRAAIMAIIALIGRGLGRPYAATAALIAAGFLMLLSNPKLLVFDTGFQLSFLATLGLIYLSPIVESKLGWVTKRWKIRETISATIAAQLAVAPWILFAMGQVSIVALPANILVLPLVPIAMLLVFITGIVGLIILPLATVIGWIAYIFLAYDVLIVRLFARVPWASAQVESVPIIFVALLYVPIVWWALKWHHQKILISGGPQVA